MKQARFAALFILAAAAAQPALAQSIAEDMHNAGKTLAPHYQPALDPVLANSSAPTGAAAAALPLPKYGGWVGVAKWSSLAAAIGFGTVGVLLSREADKSFARLVVLCEDNAETCRSLDPDGSYGDRLLEELYQDVVTKDKQARAAFIVAQVSFVASVLLFVVDFQRGGEPENEPYDPDGGQRSALHFSAVPGEVVVRYYF